MAVPTHYLKKRDVLYSPKTPSATLSRLGHEFLEKESYSDALDFFEKAEDEDGIKEIKQIALKRGDTFLLSRLERYDPSLVEEKDWEAAGRKAGERKMPSMTQFAEERLHPTPEEGEGTTPGEAPIEEG